MTQEYDKRMAELNAKLDAIKTKQTPTIKPVKPTKEKLTEFETSMPKVKTEQKPKRYQKIKKRKLTDRIKNRLFPDKNYLINMELRNGMQRCFLVSIKNESFKFMGGTFIIDPELKYYNIDDRIYCLDYNQDFALPIKREFKVAEIKQGIKATGLCEVESASNPYVLEDFVERKVIEQVMRGQDFNEVLKSIKIGVLIAASAAVIHLVIFIFKSGMLNQVGGGLGL